VPTPNSQRRSADDPRGQILAIVALGFLVMVSAMGLVVDGGMAWGQQRDNQNAADAVSEAGALVLAERLGGGIRTDGDVLNAVNGSVTANGVVKVGAWYTDILGTLVDGAGGTVGSTAAAAAVGGGSIPPNAFGVQANTSKTFDTFLMQVIGRPTLTTMADATAVAGYIEGVCPSAAGCNVLPVTIPLNVVTCDGSGDIAVQDPPSVWGTPTYFNIPYTIPLCKNGPGNVGFLDWHYPSGGTSEIVEAIGPPGTLDYQFAVPGWFSVASTGNINSSEVEDAINAYARIVPAEPVLIPMFDATCNTPPTGPGVLDCPPPNVGGSGTNQWYHLDRFVAFQLDHPKGAFMSGANPQCDTGNGATACLKGMFVRFIGPGATVGPAPGTAGDFSAIGIQLIK
jgi:Putative Flp pilus-assembly TadE/G-like